MKEVNVKIRKEGGIRYIDLFNGLFGLTSRELDVLEMFIKADRNIKRKGIPLHFLDTPIRKIIEKNLELKNVAVYVKGLRDKKAIIKGKDGKEVIHPILLDDGSDEIVVKLNRISTNGKGRG